MAITLDKIEKDNKFRALLIGPQGSGKTIAATSFPGKTLIFDFDKRYAPIIDFYPKRLGEISIEVITTKNYWTHFHKVVNELQEFCQYDNVIVDGITGMSTTTVVMQMELKQGNNSLGPKASGTKVVGGIAVPSWDEFNGEAMLITGLLESLKSLKCNLFVSAHPIPKTNMASGAKSESIVAFGTKVAPMIPGYFDEIYYFDYEFGMSLSEPPKRVVRTRPSAEYPGAKTAIHGLPPVIDITSPAGTYTEGKGLYEQLKKYLV